MSIEKLTANITVEFVCDQLDNKMFERLEVVNNDPDYCSFIRARYNGGFFYGKSLQLYEFSERDDFNNIESINKRLREAYGKILNIGLAFGQEIFGNQFMFDKNTGQVVLFNIETGESEFMAVNFSEWVKVIVAESDYYTGRNIGEAWVRDRSLNFNERLCPKIPFILGGDYVVDNQYVSSYPSFINTNANIAVQVFGLPNGTQFSIKIQNSDRLKDKN